MAWLSRVLYGLRACFRRAQVDQEMDDEIRAYVEALADRKVRAGLSPEAASRAALTEVGRLDLVKDQMRDVGWESLVDTFAADVRHALRRLRASPGFAAVAILTLALGIGANTAIFSLVNGLLLRPTLIPNEDRLVAISETRKSTVGPIPVLTGDEYRAIDAQHLPAIESMFVSDVLTGALSTIGQGDRVAGESVSGHYFEAIGVRPVVGRLLAPVDDRDAAVADAPIVISEGLWRRWFNASPSAIGTVTRMGGYSWTIVGVVPASFHGTWLPTMVSADIWVPMIAADRLRTVLESSADAPHRTFARLRPGFSLTQVDAAISTIGRAVHANEPDVRVAVLPARRAILFDDFAKPGLLIGTVVMALSSLVFLIACANLTNLLLARAMTRTGEIAIRLAIGASRARVFRLLLVEAVLVTGLSGAVGIAVSWALTSLMTRFPLPEVDGITVRFDPSPDWRVFGYAFAVAAVAAMAIGLVPAWRASRTQPLRVLAGAGSTGTETRRGQRLRKMLVAGQVALSIVLLLIAGLYVRSALRGATFDPGFDISHGAVASVDMSLEKFDEARGRRLARRMIDAAGRIPGVEHVVIASGLGTVGSTRGTSFLLPEGEAPALRGFGFPSGYFSAYADVSPGLFAALHLPLRRGRDFTETDDIGAPRVVIVSESVAARFWPGQNPLGRRLSIEKDGPLREVVGVVGPVGTGISQRPHDLFLYLPIEQDYSPRMSIFVTTTGSPAGLIDPLRQAIRSVDPELVPFDVKTLADSVGVILAPIRAAAVVLGSLSLLGFGIAVLGLYAVMAYFVSQRTREFGIRRALGATSERIYAIVVYSGIRVLMMGIAVGLPVAFVAAGLLRHLLYGIEPHDVTTFTVVPLALVAVGIAASCVAARRGARVNPNEVLRDL